VIMLEPVSIMPLLKLFLPHLVVEVHTNVCACGMSLGAQFHECQRKQSACMSHCVVFVMASLGMEMMD